MQHHKVDVVLCAMCNPFLRRCLQMPSYYIRLRNSRQKLTKSTNTKTRTVIVFIFYWINSPPCTFKMKLLVICALLALASTSLVSQPNAPTYEITSDQVGQLFSGVLFGLYYDLIGLDVQECLDDIGDIIKDFFMLVKKQQNLLIGVSLEESNTWLRPFTLCIISKQPAYKGQKSDGS